MFRLNVIAGTFAQRQPPSSLIVHSLLALILLASPLTRAPSWPSTINAIAHGNSINHAHQQQLHAAPSEARSLLLEETSTTTPTTTTSTTTSAPAVAQEAPDFEHPIGNQTVPVGREAQLSCKIRNLGNFRTAWLRVEDKGILTIHNNVITRNYRFGLLINEDENEFILTIKNVEPSDKGGYMCQINSVPMRYAVGYLDVLTPPVFEDSASADGASDNSQAPDGELSRSLPAAATISGASNSSQVTVRENTSATLSCRASGHPSPTITWRREDGRPILLNGIDSSLDASSIELKDTTSLSFNSIHRTNSGAYLCIASNGVQPSASKRQLLDVQFSPIVTLPRAEVPGQLGQLEARLECLVELNPLGSYHWIKLATSTSNTDRKPMVANQEDDLWLIEHDELLQSDKFDIVIKQINSEKVQMILTLRNIERQDFSWYKCVARNSLGLQSNFIRFFESVTPAKVAPSSSFSFNSMFRGGGGGGNQPSEPEDPQAKDEQDNSGRQAGNNPARGQTRSSWIQRSTTSGSAGSRARVESSASAASSASPTAVRLTPAPWPLLGSLLPALSTNFMSHCHPVVVVSMLPHLVAALLLIVLHRPH